MTAFTRNPPGLERTAESPGAFCRAHAQEFGKAHACIKEPPMLRRLFHKKGHNNRAILLRGKNEPKAATLRDCQGLAYLFEQALGDGHCPWRLHLVSHRMFLYSGSPKRYPLIN